MWWHHWYNLVMIFSSDVDGKTQLSRVNRFSNHRSRTTAIAVHSNWIIVTRIIMGRNRDWVLVCVRCWKSLQFHRFIRIVCASSFTTPNIMRRMRPSKKYCKLAVNPSFESMQRKRFVDIRCVICRWTNGNVFSAMNWNWSKCRDGDI